MIENYDSNLYNNVNNLYKYGSNLYIHMYVCITLCTNIINYNNSMYTSRHTVYTLSLKKVRFPTHFSTLPNKICLVGCVCVHVCMHVRKCMCTHVRMCCVCSLISGTLKLYTYEITYVRTYCYYSTYFKTLN